MRKIENMMLTVFLVVSLICGKFLLDYWQDSYDNRQNYRQVEEIAFPEKDTQEEETEPNEDNPTTEIDDFDYQSLLDENADCIGWLKISDTDISYPVVLGEDNEFYLHHDFQKNYAICSNYQNVFVLCCNRSAFGPVQRAWNRFLYRSCCIHYVEQYRDNFLYDVYLFHVGESKENPLYPCRGIDCNNSGNCGECSACANVLNFQEKKCTN